MTDTHDEQLAELNRGEQAAQWLLAAVTDDDETLDRLQEWAEHACVCCAAKVTRRLALTAGILSRNLYGPAQAVRNAEEAVAGWLDEIAELEVAVSAEGRITAEQMMKLAALMDKAGLSTPGSRQRFAEAALDRAVPRVTSLTRDDADRLAELLEAGWTPE
jgi:hypothetical protein